jgi:hypothetical protein
MLRLDGSAVPLTIKKVNELSSSSLHLKVFISTPDAVPAVAIAELTSLVLLAPTI